MSRSREWPALCLPLLCGLLLRAWMVHRFALVAGDSFVYGWIAQNWLQHGVYAFSHTLRPTLIRLPGYPLFIAAVFKLFGIGNYVAVLRVQVWIDLASCVLVAMFVREFAGPRRAVIALWLAALCPFTASYVAAPLTETLSIFCVALAMLAAAKCLPLSNEDRVPHPFGKLRAGPTDGFIVRRVGAHETFRWKWLLVLAFALSYAILLRPDGVLLAAAILGYLMVRARHSRAALAKLAAVSILTLLPLVPWTIRNERTFHLFQPLAPRYANDPGEPSEAGYKAWVKTWFIDAASNEEFYWCANDCPLDIRLLPDRAFDSPAQHHQTEQLLLAVNQATLESNTPDPRDPVGTYDSEFDSLGRTRAADDPLRTFVTLPIARLADMLLRPRTELFPVPARWWEFRAHSSASWFAFAYAALNAAYLLLAAVGFLRRRVPLAPMLLGYVALRCLLLLTLENAEPRYTLEFFPIVIAAAALALW